MANVVQNLCSLCRKQPGDQWSDWGKICSLCATQAQKANLNLAPDEMGRLFAAPPERMMCFVVMQGPKRYLVTHGTIWAFRQQADAEKFLEWAQKQDYCRSGIEKVVEIRAREVFEWAMASGTRLQSIYQGMPPVDNLFGNPPRLEEL